MENRIQLAEYFNELGFKEGVEVGVADGRFSLTLCQKIPGLMLACVDPWSPYSGNRRGGGEEQHDRNYLMAMERLFPYTAKFYKMKSMEAVKFFKDESLDFVYIDGNHDFEYVLEDIDEWSKKVRKGGIVSGHDYYEFNNSGVIQAVKLYASERNVEVNVIGEMKKHSNDDFNPSWYFIKP